MVKKQIWRENFGKLKAARRKKHTYLGIDLDYTKPGEVSLSRIKYVKEMLEAFPDQEEISKKQQYQQHQIYSKLEMQTSWIKWQRFSTMKQQRVYFYAQDLV